MTKTNMSQANSRTICLLQLTTATTTGTAADMVLPMGYTGAIVSLAVSTVSGTSPTLNVYVQNRLRQAASTDTTGLDVANTATAIYDDLISFTQSTTSSSTYIARLVGGGNHVGVLSTNALSAASVQSGPIGSTWRVSYVIGGTSPSFAFSVVAELVP